jgi:hypothetical protein
MSTWGDVVGSDNQEPPDSLVNFNDISSLVDKFGNQPGAPAKSRADIDPDIPNQIIDFTDISRVVDAFRGLACPYTGPPITDPCGRAARVDTGLGRYDPHPSSRVEPVVISLEPSAWRFKPACRSMWMRT